MEILRVYFLEGKVHYNWWGLGCLLAHNKSANIIQIDIVYMEFNLIANYLIINQPLEFQDVWYKSNFVVILFLLLLVY